MRTALHVLTDELRRLKNAGVKTVPVSEESLAALRNAMASARAVAAEAPVRAPVRIVAAAPARDRPAPKPAAVAEDAPPPAPVFPPPPKFELPAGDKAARWAALLERVRADPVCAARLRPGKRAVLGVGNLDAKIMFVGEAPGAEEEIQGEPFVGPAGQLLNKMILGMGLARSDVYIGNIMNWRPDLPAGPDGLQYGNRPPTAEEMAYCMPFLQAQIEIVDPAILVALGGSAAQALLGAGSFKTLGEIRGIWREYCSRPLIVTYHPSYILRNPTNRSKRLIWEDFLKVMERAALPLSDKQRGFFLEK